MVSRQQARLSLHRLQAHLRHYHMPYRLVNARPCLDLGKGVYFLPHRPNRRLHLLQQQQ